MGDIMGFNFKSTGEKIKKSFSGIYLEVLKGLAIALVISLALILISALILSFVEASDLAINIINQVIRAISLLVACIIAFKEKSNGWKKGLFLGILYAIVAYLMFSLMDGKFEWGWKLLIDFVASAIMGTICGVVAVNIHKKR